MSKPRILIIENSIAITGALKSIIRSSQGLANDYDFVFLLPENSSGTKDLKAVGFEVYEMPMREIRKNMISIISYLPALLRNTRNLFQFVQRHKIDLMVVNDFYNLLAPVYKIFGGKIPYVCYVRFLPSKFPSTLVKVWCALHHRYAQTTVVVSEAVKRELTYEENVVVIGNELPPEETPLSSTSLSTTVLYPANYIRGKGHEYALQSWAMISKKHPGWKLRLVGGDMGLMKNKQFKQDLVKLSQELQLDNQVEWCDFSERISAEYLAAAFVLNFSESESFSLTCLEGMFYGRPVIATRSGGPAEIIDHNDSGVLVELKDVEAMAMAMDELITNTGKREAMGRRAYDSVRQRFSFANTVGKLGAVYKQALRSPA